MKFKKYFIGLTLIVGFFAEAAFDEMVFIQGQIGNAFDKSKVKAIDSYGQSFYLPKSVFPKGFKFEAGKIFNVEITLDQCKELDTKKAHF